MTGLSGPPPLFRTWQPQRRARAYPVDAAEGARFHVPGQGWKWDFSSQSYNVNLGHGRREVIEAMRAALDTVLTAGPNVDLPVRWELARRLCALAGMDRVFFALGGAEAVENAVKIAMLVTGRSKVVARRASYHGATLATLGFAGDPRRAFFGRALSPGHWIDDPYPPRPPAGGRPSDWVENLEAAVERAGPSDVAAIVLEGLTGTNGVQIPPADFWPAARRIADEAGIVLVADEVFSGLGRTGRTFGFEHFGGAPDAIVLGKGLTSGYAPLSAVIVSERIARHFDDEVLACGLTHYASPIGCAAAMACLDVIEAEGLVGRAARLGEVLAAGLTGLSAVRPEVADARGRGLQWVVELTVAAEPVARALWALGYAVGAKGHRLFLCPPLTVEESACRAVPQALARALDHAAKGADPA